MTLTTPFQGQLVVPRLTPDIAYNRTKFDDSIASVIQEIFKDVQNLKVGHVTLTTPLSGMASYRQAVTCYDNPTHQI